MPEVEWAPDSEVAGFKKHVVFRTLLQARDLGPSGPHRRRGRRRPMVLASPSQRSYRVVVLFLLHRWDWISCAIVESASKDNLKEVPSGDAPGTRLLPRAFSLCSNVEFVPPQITDSPTQELRTKQNRHFCLFVCFFSLFKSPEAGDPGLTQQLSKRVFSTGWCGGVG